MAFFLSLKGLLVKNIRLKQRHWFATFLEFALPVLFFVIFTFLKSCESFFVCLGSGCLANGFKGALEFFEHSPSLFCRPSIASLSFACVRCPLIHSFFLSFLCSCVRVFVCLCVSLLFVSSVFCQVAPQWLVRRVRRHSRDSVWCTSECKWNSLK